MKPFQVLIADAAAFAAQRSIMACSVYTATGHDLDLIAYNMGLTRLPEETDAALRSRAQSKEERARYPSQAPKRAPTGEKLRPRHNVVLSGLAK